MSYAARDDLERLWQRVSQTQSLLLVARYPKGAEQVADLVGGRRKMPAGTATSTRPRPLVVQAPALVYQLTINRIRARLRGAPYDPAHDR